MPIFSDPAQRLAWVSAAPLLLRRGAQTASTDVQELAELVALTIPLVDFGPFSPRRPFLHRSCTEVIGNIAITNSVHTGVIARTDASPEALIHLPLAGLGFECRSDGRAWRVCPGERGLYLPGLPAEVEAGPGAGVVYNLDPELLARHVCFLARHPGLGVERVRRRLQQPIAIDLTHPRVMAAWSSLRGLLQRLDHQCLPGQCQGWSDALHPSRLQDVIYGASARLLLPDLF